MERTELWRALPLRRLRLRRASPSVPLLSPHSLSLSLSLSRLLSGPPAALVTTHTHTHCSLRSRCCSSVSPAIACCSKGASRCLSVAPLHRRLRTSARSHLAQPFFSSLSPLTVLHHVHSRRPAARRFVRPHFCADVADALPAGRLLALRDAERGGLRLVSAVRRRSTAGEGRCADVLPPTAPAARPTRAADQARHHREVRCTHRPHCTPRPRRLHRSPLAPLCSSAVHGRPEKYVVHAEMPGVKKDDIRLNVEDGVLTISAEKRDEHEEQRQEQRGWRTLRREIAYGTVTRAIRLPPDAKADAVNARFQDGVLEVVPPAHGLSADTQPRAAALTLGASLRVCGRSTYRARRRRWRSPTSRYSERRDAEGERRPMGTRQGR